MAKRLHAMNNPRYINCFQVTLHHDLIELPLKWKKPRMVFVNSMSDLFHEDVPDEFIKAVFNTMKNAHWHTFQILTKRSKRLMELALDIDWPPNVWQGVTVENQNVISRVDDLRKVPASTRFLSIEPFIGPIKIIDLTGIHWVIVGGESGPGARPMEESWVNLIFESCKEQKVPFFFKQWGGVQKHRKGRLFKEQTWDQFPERNFT